MHFKVCAQDCGEHCFPICDMMHDMVFERRKIQNDNKHFFTSQILNLFNSVNIIVLLKMFTMKVTTILIKCLQKLGSLQ